MNEANKLGISKQVLIALIDKNYGGESVFYGISDWQLVSSSLSLNLIRAIIVAVGVAIYNASTVRVKVKA